MNPVQVNLIDQTQNSGDPFSFMCPETLTFKDLTHYILTSHKWNEKEVKIKWTVKNVGPGERDQPTDFVIKELQARYKLLGNVSGKTFAIKVISSDFSNLDNKQIYYLKIQHQKNKIPVLKFHSLQIK